MLLESDKRLKGKAKDIWELICNPKKYHSMSPDVKKVEAINTDENKLGHGMQFRIHHDNGNVWQEKCIEWQPHTQLTMQVITDAYPVPIPIKSLIYTIELKQRRVSTQLALSYRYVPKYGLLGAILDRHVIRPILTTYAAQLMNNLSQLSMQLTQDVINVSKILAVKNSSVHSIDATTSIDKVCHILSEQKIGCVLVLDKEAKIDGILSERDIVRGMNKTNQSIMDHTASQYMTAKVICCHPDDDLTKIMAIMTDKNIRHLPVVDDNQTVLGMISIGDLVKARIAELEHEYAAMNQYIEGRKWREVSLQVGRSTASKKLEST